MKTRIIHTKIWQDDFFVELKPTEKVLFLYLLSNDKVNVLFCYECSKRVISFETGLTIEEVTNAKKKLEDLGKIACFKDYIFLPNSHKYEQYSGPLHEKAKNDLIYRMSWDVQQWFLSVAADIEYDQSYKPVRYQKASQGGYQHRVVAERILGRKLTSDEEVHHIDKNITNNKPWNLAVVSRKDHHLIHNGTYKGVISPLQTPSKGDINKNKEIINNKTETIKQNGFSTNQALAEDFRELVRSKGISV